MADTLPTIDQGKVSESPPAKDRRLNNWATPPVCVCVCVCDSDVHGEKDCAVCVVVDSPVSWRGSLCPYIFITTSDGSLNNPIRLTHPRSRWSRPTAVARPSEFLVRVAYPSLLSLHARFCTQSVQFWTDFCCGIKSGGAGTPSAVKFCYRVSSLIFALRLQLVVWALSWWSVQFDQFLVCCVSTHGASRAQQFAKSGGTCPPCIMELAPLIKSDTLLQCQQNHDLSSKFCISKCSTCTPFRQQHAVLFQLWFFRCSFS